MLYILGFFIPFVAVLMCGRIFQSVLNFILCCTVVGIPIAIIHAWVIVYNTYNTPVYVQSMTSINIHNHNGNY